MNQGLLITTGAFSLPLNGVNGTAGFKNPDGTINVSGTVIGISQMTLSAVDFGSQFTTIGSTTAKTLPLAGGAVAFLGIQQSLGSIQDAINGGKPIKVEDISGVVGGVATLVGSAGALAGAMGVFVTASGVIVPVAAVAGVAAGTVQLVAMASGWAIGGDGTLAQKPLSSTELSEINKMLGQSSSPLLGLINQPNVSGDAATGLGTSKRDSTDFADISGTHTGTVKNSDGGVDDIWVLEKQAGNVFDSRIEFRQAVLVCNPDITDINKIPAGKTLYIPEKLSDGSITYHYATGVSINNNAATGEYNMLPGSASITMPPLANTT